MNQQADGKTAVEDMLRRVLVLLIEVRRHDGKRVTEPAQVVAGTDKGVPGFSLQREIELYVGGGMTPLQAIQTATIMPARAMRLDKELGTLEVGKRADLVVLDGNPLEGIHNMLKTKVVFKGGKIVVDKR